MMGLEIQSRSTDRLQFLASSVPIGQRGLVHIWGRNDTSITQDLGISWVVRDPDGKIAEEYSDWSYGHGPGDDHEFIGGRFDLSKTGTYTLKADLLMGSPNSPVVVDSYVGDLCVVTTELPPEYELVKDVLDPYAYVFEGNAETCVFEFKLLPEQLEVIPGMDAFTEWLINKLIEGSVSGLEKQGSRLLGIKLYRDTTPALWTDYRCEVTATASPLGWVAIVVIIVALLLVLTYGIVFPIHKLFFKPSPLSEEIKKTWGRDTLMSAINDFEVKLERTPTPPEDLDKMSDQELRDYCDGLAEEVVPPKAVSWWPFAVLGGLGIAAVAVLKPKTKKA